MLLGSQYDFSAVDLDGVVVNAGHWIWKNTGVADGDRIPGVVGYEVDGRFGNEPEGTETVMSTPYVHFDGKRSDATMTTYGKRVATVVNTGTMQWVWGLDGFQFSSALDKPGNYPLRSFENTVVKQATRNILKRFGAVPGPRRAMSGRSRFVRSLIDRDRDMMA